MIVTDDGMPYRDMIRALDLARAYDYHQPLIGGASVAAVGTGTSP